MKTIKLLISLLCFGFFAAAQERIILDTDIDSDVDDVEALAMLHSLADQKKINFLGIIVTSDDPFAATCTSVINKYYGRAKLPIGVLKNQKNLKNHSKYTRQLSEEFPKNLNSHENAEDATVLYRKLLSKSPDHSVVIVTIGHLTNLQNLLLSKPDKHSKLSGKELVEKKVKKWLCMGGMFPEGKEANFYRPDPGSTVVCLKEWTKPVVFAGWEVGELVKTGGKYLKEKLDAKSPVYRAYQLYNNFYGRASWDQIAVFLLMEESNKYFDLEDNGYCHVYDNGSNKWIFNQKNNEKLKHAFVKFKANADYKEISRIMDDMTIK